MDRCRLEEPGNKLASSWAIEYGENSVSMESSAVTYVRLIGPRRTGKWIHALGREAICRAEFELSCDWPYARLEIEDAGGKRACPILYGILIRISGTPK